MGKFYHIHNPQPLNLQRSHQRRELSPGRTHYCWRHQLGLPGHQGWQSFWQYLASIHSLGGRCNQARALEEDLWAAKGLRCKVSHANSLDSQTLYGFLHLDTNSYPSKVHPRRDVGSVDGPRWQLLALGRIWRRVFLQRRVQRTGSHVEKV